MIEGNLRLLYDPEHVCTAREQIDEWILLQGHPGSAPEQRVAALPLET
ncbi:MAG: hypothetical protein NTW83_13565 [Cyanobacteria bacterium]|nr:hypothetical protein [Cyanobacteriota bacterium]